MCLLPCLLVCYSYNRDLVHLVQKLFTVEIPGRALRLLQIYLMTGLYLRYLALVLTLLLAFTIATNASAVPRLEQTHVQELRPYHVLREDFDPPADLQYTPDLTVKTSVNTSIMKRQLNFDQLWSRLRIGTIYMVYSVTRVNSLANPNPSPPDPFIQYLKEMYSDIRREALSGWARLPEQSYVRVVYGNIIFTVLPPADRMVPWSVVEEISYGLLLLVSAGLGGLITGTYLPMATSVAAWYYVQVIMPVPEGLQGQGAGNGPGKPLVAAQGVQSPPS